MTPKAKDMIVVYTSKYIAVTLDRDDLTDRVGGGKPAFFVDFGWEYHDGQMIWKVIRRPNSEELK